MTGERLPVVISPYGPFAGIALHVHDLAMRGMHVEALTAADSAHAIALLLRDQRTARMVELAQMYALLALGRLQEALEIGEKLSSQQGPLIGPYATDAKILADTAEVLIRLGHLDQGLHLLARAIATGEVAPRGDIRFVSAASSLSEAALAAELFEFADVCLTAALSTACADDRFRWGLEVQRAELLLEWALRLEQVGRGDEATRLYHTSHALLRRWVHDPAQTPLAAALLAVTLAKLDGHAEALALRDTLLIDQRRNGHNREARLLHLAAGLALRATGDLPAAQRELVAADELSDSASQRAIISYELATLAVAEHPCPAARTLLSTVQSQINWLWRLRQDRRAMLRQAHKRVELEEARKRADAAAAADALTGLGNRRAFDRHLASLDGETVLLLIDVDKFKLINDQHSHVVGDQVLREIAMILRSHLRADDAAVRLGGDEFAVLLRKGDHPTRHVAERIRKAVAQHDWDAVASGLRVTLSMGVGVSSPGISGAELYGRADEQLYTAKRQGRNRVAA